MFLRLNMFLNNKYYISKYYSNTYLKDPRVQMAAFVKKSGFEVLKIVFLTI